MKEKVDTFLKEFEWTWTTAVLAAFGFVVFMVAFAVILPSAWVYFAEQKLGWAGPTDIQATVQSLSHPMAGQPFYWLHPVMTLKNLAPEIGKEIRDAIAMGITTVFFALPFVVGAVLQNRRRKMRGASDSRPTGGYR
jgi:hypothetical protein